MPKPSPPKYTAPLPLVLAQRAWHYLTWWPWQTRQLRQMGMVRTGWMTWQTPSHPAPWADPETAEVLADLREARRTARQEPWHPQQAHLPCGWPPHSDPTRYCRRCDLFIGFGAAGIAHPPAEHETDIGWLETHCWICRRTAQEIAADDH
jgi:hypothetical protein